MLYLDFETRSRVDLKRAGPYKYCADPSTEIMTLGALYQGDEILSGHILEPNFKQKVDKLKELIHKADIIIAHNASFERYVILHCLGLKVPPSKFHCTMAMALACSLPRKLEMLAHVLEVGEKDMTGRRTMLKYSKPNKNGDFLADADAMQEVQEYCNQDVFLTRDIYAKLPKLPPTEQKIWCLNEEINERGFKIDTDLVSAVLCGIETESQRLDKIVKEMTGIDSATQRNKVLEYMQFELGESIESLTKQTVQDALKTATGDLKILLEARQARSKSSTAKYQAMQDRVGPDGYIRDNLIYHVASTGRFGGSGVQPQNFPRGEVKKPEQYITQVFFDMDMDVPVMSLYASLLRSCILPDQGDKLITMDYSAIEARVLFWLANEEKGLRAYREGVDIYKLMAAQVFHTTVDKVNTDQRFIGKSLTLGAGFGLGAVKFNEAMQAQGAKSDEDMAKTAIDTYRKYYSNVPKLWYGLEKAAKAAVKRPKTMFPFQGVTYYFNGVYLVCQLPSGRAIRYYHPTVTIGNTKVGPKEILKFWAVNSLTKKWNQETTYSGKLTENVVQATARDLMVAAMLRLKEHDYKIILTVHDELLVSGQAREAENIKKLILTLPAWAKGLPIDGTMNVLDRYAK